MSVDHSEMEKVIGKIAQLAKIKLAEEEIPEMTQRLSSILNLVDELQTADTDNIEPMAHPLDAVQRLRADLVTEGNQREAFQAIAPKAEQGLYLVPKVID